MFDLGWSKLLLIAIIAIVVVGPKDLPPLLRALGKFISQLRRQAEDFRAHFNDAMRDTGFDEIKRDVQSIKATASETATDISRSLDESVKPLHEAAADIQRSGDLSTPTADLPPLATEPDLAVASISADPAPPYLNGHGTMGTGHGEPVLASEITLAPPDAPAVDVQPASAAAKAAAAAAGAKPEV
jgi:sec-independent protein translocase protein TatB